MTQAFHKCIFSALSLLFIVPLLTYGQSQQPSATPLPAVPNKKSDVLPDKKPPLADREIAFAVPAAIDKLTTEIAGLAKAEEAANREKDSQNNFLEKHSNGVIAFFTIVLAIVGISQARIYSSQADLMKESLHEARRAADAANASVEVMKNNAEIQLRAYVGIELAGEQLSDQFPADFAIRIANAGSTPAIDVKSQSNWYFFPGQLFQPPDTFTYPLSNDGNGSTLTLRPQIPLVVTFPLTPQPNGTPFSAFLQQALNGQGTMFYYGTFVLPRK